MNKKIVIAVGLLIASSAVFAGGENYDPKPNPPSPSTDVSSVSSSSSKSSAEAGALAVGVGVGLGGSVKGSGNSTVESTVNSAGGAGGTGGAGGSVSGSGNSAQNQTANSSTENSGNNTGNSNVTVNGGNTTYNQVRQAPAVSQGSFAIQGCGAAGNAGGSNSHGAAFLGFGFTPDQCYDYLLAQSYQAIGQTKAACEVLNTTKAAKRAAKNGVTLPSCEPEVHVVEKVVEKEVQVPVPQPPVNLEEYVTKKDLAERDHRLLQQLLSK